jgi:hypothetical protein
VFEIAALLMSEQLKSEGVQPRRMRADARRKMSSLLEAAMETRMGGTPSKIKQILACIAEAIRETTKEVHAYIKKDPFFNEIGERMLKEWQTGASLSLRQA